MANYASASYALCGETTKVKKLFDSIKAVLATDRSYEQDHSTFLPHSNWLGYLVSDLLGMSYKDDTIRCRGSIVYIDNSITTEGDLAHFELMTESAWTDCRELFYRIGEKFDVEILFVVEELGCDIFETNDEQGRFFPYRYMLDDFEGEGAEYYCEFDSVADIIEELTGERPVRPEEVEEILERHDMSENYSFHEIGYTSLSDF